MKEDVKKLLARQGAWQKGRKSMSWAEKVKMIERILPELAVLAGLPRRRKETPHVGRRTD